PPVPQQENQIYIAEDRNRAIRDYTLPVFQTLNPGILEPPIDIPQFELKPVMFQMLNTMGQFSGLPNEDPHKHIKLFFRVCNSFKVTGVPEDTLKLKIFPFSLQGDAEAWLDSFPPNSITSWNDLAEKFLEEVFPSNKNVKYRAEIIAFRQSYDEPLDAAWERFQRLVRKCPHHGLSTCIILEHFYSGLDQASKALVNASANGSFLKKSANEVHAIIDTIATNNRHWGETEPTMIFCFSNS
ncbi:MAG: retrotransposon gag domain-containing protein, partial [Sweet potato little leaf phytoplasma]|nr:retrotransposon gag domain-containing protein [Sweet potato little leaf phytoplasma]